MGLIHEAQHAEMRPIDQLADGLVVKVIDMGPFEALAHVQLLLTAQSVAYELLMNAFGAVIDGQLLQLIAASRLKAIEVQDGEMTLRGLRATEPLVDACHQPGEQSTVQGTTQSMAQ